MNKNDKDYFLSIAYLMGVDTVNCGDNVDEINTHLQKIDLTVHDLLEVYLKVLSKWKNNPSTDNEARKNSTKSKLEDRVTSIKEGNTRPVGIPY